MIIDKDMIENVTLAYLHSHKIALENTHNPDFALQVAMMVVTILVNKKESEKIDPLQMLISLAVKERQQEDDNNSSDKEDKT